MSNWSWLNPHGDVPNDSSAHSEERTGNCSLPTSDNRTTAANNASASNAHETSVLRNVTRLRRNAITPAGFESASVIVEIRVLTSERIRMQRSRHRLESIDETWTRPSKIVVVDLVNAPCERRRRLAQRVSHGRVCRPHRSARRQNDCI